MQCPACDFQSSQQDFGDPLCCPSCGAFYAKALAAKQRRENSPEALPVKAVAIKKGGAKKWLAAVCVLLVGGYLVASPYIAVYQIRQAAKARDADALERYIDFPRVRESLKEQINAKVMATAATELADNPFAAFGMAFAGAMVDRLVSAAVTPAGLAEMMKGEKPKLKGASQPAGSAPKAPAMREPLSDAEMGYQGFSRFVVSVPSKDGSGPVRFILTRSGLSWQVSDVKIPL